MQLRSLKRAWRTKPWIKLLFGAIWPPSMAERGVERWISCWRDFPASPLASPESGEEQPTSDGSGRMCGASSGSVERGCSSSKTLVAFVPKPSSGKSSWTWPKAGALRSGRVFLRQRWVPRTNESDCSWLWPTPNAARVANRLDTQCAGSREGEVPNKLGWAVAKWPSPKASDGSKGDPNQRYSSGGTDLSASSVKWMTPTTRDGKDGSEPSLNAPTNGLLGRQSVRSLPDQTSLTCGAGCSKCRRTLNPLFVEWLMGWPIGFTACAPLETASYLFRLRQQLRIFFTGS